MSDERDSVPGGAPVEQQEATETQVQAAVNRATDSDSVTSLPGADTVEAPAVAQGFARPKIAPVVEAPSAANTETAGDIFDVQLDKSPAVSDAVTPVAVAASATESASASEPEIDAPRDGEIRIDANHPMAALYMQSPMPPEVRGNRAGGALISLLATLGFAVVYAGVLAIWQAPNYPPSTYLNEGLLPWVLNWGFAAAVMSFFLSLLVLVMIAGRAGWWAYVIGGLPVAVLVWVLTLVSYAFTLQMSGEPISWSVSNLLAEFGLFLPVIAAAIVAREITIWFGAWIGARGRKLTQENAEAIAEYEQALAEVQAK